MLLSMVLTCILELFGCWHLILSPLLVCVMVEAKPVKIDSMLSKSLTSQQPSSSSLPSPSATEEDQATAGYTEYWMRWESDITDSTNQELEPEVSYSSSTLFSEEDGIKFASKIRRERIVRLSKGCGRGKNMIATLSDGTKVCCRYREVQWREVRGEFYSYHFNNLLGLFNAPPATLVRVNFSSPQWEEVVSTAKEAGWIDRVTIVVTLFVEHLESERFPLVLREPDALVTEDAMSRASLMEKSRLLQWSDLIVFDFIAGHSDRIFNSLFNLQWNDRMLQKPIHNLLKTKESDSKLLLFDNESGFWMGYRMEGFHYDLQEQFLRKLCVFRNETVKRVRDLLHGNKESESASERLESYIKRLDARSFQMVEPLDSKQRQEFETRLKLVVKQVDKCRAL